jgi:hypothetical protein
MKKKIILTFGLFFVLLLSACSILPQNGNADLPNSTAVYGTVAADLTETANKTDSPAVQTITALPNPSKTPIPSPETTTRPSPTIVLDKSTTQAPTKHAVPCNLAAPGRPFVDITVPDGTHFNPGEGFSKTWRLVNAGSCNWTNDYAIAWFSGEVFGAVTEQRFGLEVLPGQSIDITVDMTAPRQPGVHQSNWKLRDASGALFGIGPNGDAPFWVRIEVDVIANATVTPEPTSTFTPTPLAVAKGAFQMTVGTPVDLDTGKENTGTGDDLELQEKDGDNFVLVLLNGTTMGEMPGQSPVLGDCLNASLVNQPVPAASLKEGSTYCYRTNQGLPGYLLIKNLALVDKKISLEFLTWAIP